MLYDFRAKSAEGDMISGVIEADSTADAQQQLRRDGILLLSISPSRHGLFGSGQLLKLSRRRSVPKRELLMLTSQLAIMNKAGVDLAEALEQAAQQCSHAGLRSTLEAVHADVSDGKPIATALGRHVDVFGEGYIASVAAGEASGRMSEVLGRMADVLRSEIRLRSSIINATTYPIVLVATSSIVLMCLMFFVLPRFGAIFANMEIPTPTSTQILLGLATWLKSHPLLVFGGAVGIAISVARFLSSEYGTRLSHRFMLNTRVLRETTRALILGRVFRLMGTMLQSGVPLLEAIQLCRGSINNTVYRELFNLLEVEVLNGRGIGQALAATDFVPGGASQMVLTAERTGRLGDVMQMVGEFYEDDGERRLVQLAKLLEPAIIVVMGVLVSFVVASVMLPMLSLTRIH